MGTEQRLQAEAECLRNLLRGGEGDVAFATFNGAERSIVNDGSHRFYRAGVDQIDNHIPEKYSISDVRSIIGL
jgi:hypothetical protein